MQAIAVFTQFCSKKIGSPTGSVLDIALLCMQMDNHVGLQNHLSLAFFAGIFGYSFGSYSRRKETSRSSRETQVMAGTGGSGGGGAGSSRARYYADYIDEYDASTLDAFAEELQSRASLRL